MLLVSGGGDRKSSFFFFVSDERRARFAEVGFGYVVVVVLEWYFLAGFVSDLWAGMVETIVCAISLMMACGGVLAEIVFTLRGHMMVWERVMAWLPKCTALHERVGGWEWVNMMVLYCQRSAGADREFARRISVLLREMVDAYDERMDFIRELKAVPSVNLAVKTTEFFNETLWKDDRRAISEDLRLAREINALCARLTAVIDERENFVDELDVLVGRSVPEKMAEFMKESQGKVILNLIKLQILGREFELRAREKDLFIWVLGMPLSLLVGSLVVAGELVANMMKFKNLDLTIILIPLHKPPDRFTFRSSINGDPNFSCNSWGGNPRNVMVFRVWRKSPPNTNVFPPNRRGRDVMPDEATAKTIFPWDQSELIIVFQRNVFLVIYILSGDTVASGSKRGRLSLDEPILSDADNRPPMLEKDMYDSWKSIMELYMMNKQHGRMIIESVKNGPLLWPTIKENGVTRLRKYSELSPTDAIQADCDTLMLAEESRFKIILKQQDPMVLEKKVNTTPVDYAALNQLSQYFEKRFVPQISAKQAFWSQNSMNSLNPGPFCTPTRVEVPKELPKVSMVNTSLKKLKHHLAGVDVVVKERTMTIAITEGSWGFEHTKACFRDETIPFVKALKDIFNTFDQYLINELTKVQNVFHQMEQDEKGLILAALKDELRKLKRKGLVDNVVTTHTIAPEILKIDVEPLAPRLLNNRTTHSNYLRLTQEQAPILRECNGYMLYDNYDICVLNVVNDVNARPKSKSVKKTSKRKVWKPTGKMFTKTGYTWRPTGRTFTIVGNGKQWDWFPLLRVDFDIPRVDFDFSRVD
nr:hypothetical protein [Tanacetum cinerariifolium]